MPASSPGCRSRTSRPKPRRSVQRRYIRISISAQSCDSVPPAPGWIVTIAFFRSSSPESIVRISAVWTSRSYASSAALELRVDVLALARPLERARRDRRSACGSTRPAPARPRGAAGAAGSSARWPGPSRSRARRPAFRVRSVRAARRASSKPPPQVGGAGGEIGDRREPVRRGSWHRAQLRSTRAGASASAANTAGGRGQRQPGHDVADLAVDRTADRAAARQPSPPSSRTARVRTMHAAVRIDGAADAGVGGAHQVAALLDRAQRALLEMLIGRRRPAEPRVVGDRREQLAAALARTRATSHGYTAS